MLVCSDPDHQTRRISNVAALKNYYNAVDGIFYDAIKQWLNGRLETEGFDNKT